MGPVFFPLVGENVGKDVGGDVVRCVICTSSISRCLPVWTSYRPSSIKTVYILFKIVGLDSIW